MLQCHIVDFTYNPSIRVTVDALDDDRWKSDKTVIWRIGVIV